MKLHMWVEGLKEIMYVQCDETLVTVATNEKSIGLEWSMKACE